MTLPAYDPPSTPPLAGIIVLDLSRALAAPLCTMMLADLGATVLKVEHPVGGDQSRAWGTEIAGGQKTYFFAANRGKRSLAIDIARPEGAAIVRDLAMKSDVLVENFMRRSLPKYGLDPEALRTLNPRLIYCSLSGYGRTGPMVDRPGYDTVIQAESGIMSVTGDPNGAPAKVGMPVSDTIAGIYAAQAVLAAIIARGRTGVGQFVDISMLDCSIAALASVGTNAALLGMPAQRFGNQHADVVPQDIYPSGSGRVVVHIGTDEQFARFCADVLGLPALASDARFRTNADRARNRDAIDAIIVEAFRHHPSEHWLDLLHAAGLSAGLVRNVLDAVRSPEARARGMLVEIDHPKSGRIELVNTPLHFSDSAVGTTRPPPLLGQHTGEILRDYLGLDEARIDRLTADAIIA